MSICGPNAETYFWNVQELEPNFSSPKSSWAFELSEYCIHLSEDHSFGVGKRVHYDPVGPSINCPNDGRACKMIGLRGTSVKGTKPLTKFCHGTDRVSLSSRNGTNNIILLRRHEDRVLVGLCTVNALGRRCIGPGAQT